MTFASLVIALLSLLIGLLLLLGGGEALVSGARRLARMRGMSPLLIGLTVVAFGTSMPELFISMIATWRGHPEIMIGNVIGSNVANIGLILAISILLSPLRLSFKDVATELTMLHLATAVLFGLTFYGFFPRPVGWFFVGAIVVYTVWAYRVAIKAEPQGGEVAATTVGGEVDEPGVGQQTTTGGRGGTPDAALKGAGNEIKAVEPTADGSIAKALLLVGGGIAILIGGSELFLRGAVSLAEILGVSELVIGLTIVAVGTSLPELATCLVAIRQRQGDILVGNIIGSNLFNLLMVMGLTAAIIPFALPSQLLQRDLPVMLFFSLLILAAISYRGRLGRGLGLFMLAAYVGYLAILAGYPTAA